MKNARTSDHIFLLQTVIEKVVKKNKKKLFAAFIDFKKAYDTVDRKKLIKRLNTLGMNGIFVRNIDAMYSKIAYRIKLSSGDSEDILSNLGLKQGCPLSPMLFNMYIDDINEIFDKSCDPVDFHNEPLSHFLYADDLILISESREGLQNCLDKVHEFASSKNLTISIKKSKCMIFNQTGKLEKHVFTVNGRTLETVNSFCYLGFDVKCSGTVKHAMNVLNDKAKKALMPLMNAIVRFKIPAKTSIRLFHTYISPILLYNFENWLVLSDKKIKNFNTTSLYSDIAISKIDLVHRKILKFVLGVSKSCPNLAVYGETGETPLSYKGYRMTINFWHRVTNLPDTTLVKKAMLENIGLRTNWIITMEKMINHFKLADTLGSQNLCKIAVKKKIDSNYCEAWSNDLLRPEIRRMDFYRKLKTNIEFEDYLRLEDFEKRKTIAKLRCSNHSLEIEKGRHHRPKIERMERVCKQCEEGAVETEVHFLLECSKYDLLKEKYNLKTITTIQQLMYETPKDILGEYLINAFSVREIGYSKQA